MVAVLAGGNDIALGSSAAPGDGYDVIHGEFLGRERPAAVMAETSVALTFPPLGAAQLPRFLALPLDLVLGKCIGVWVHL